VPLTNKSDLDPAISVIDLQDAIKKLFFSKFFSVLLFESTFTSFFKEKNHKEVSKTIVIKVFSILLDDRRTLIHTSD
jgi:hypothetical protein